MQPSTTRPCPECGGQRVEVEDRMHIRGGSMSYAMYLKQWARSRNIFKRKSNKSETITLTCIRCGYTAWYATEPSNLIPDG
jgi:predicted nucleic-acid-binding Zn-ribbon protein